MRVWRIYVGGNVGCKLMFGTFPSILSIQKYVIEKALQCVAVIIKRGTLEHSYNNGSLQRFMGNVHQLFSSEDPKMVSTVPCEMNGWWMELDWQKDR